jgi:hypothetical protein
LTNVLIICNILNPKVFVERRTQVFKTGDRSNYRKGTIIYHQVELRPHGERRAKAWKQTMTLIYLPGNASERSLSGVVLPFDLIPV